MDTPKGTYDIDATGRTLGRVAAETAKALMGKTRADYTPHILSDIKVTVSNAGKIRMTERKRMQSDFRHYSGHPGGLKKESLGSLVGRKGKSEALRRTVVRMLPRNRMRTKRLKNLTINE